MTGYRIDALNQAPIEVNAGGSVTNILTYPRASTLVGKAIEIEVGYSFPNTSLGVRAVALVIKHSGNDMTWLLKGNQNMTSVINHYSLTNIIMSFYHNAEGNVVAYMSQQAAGASYSFGTQSIAGEAEGNYEITFAPDSQISFDIAYVDGDSPLLIQRYSFAIIDDQSVYKLPAPIEWPTATVAIRAYFDNWVDKTIEITAVARSLDTVTSNKITSFNLTQGNDDGLGALINMQSVQGTNWLRAMRWVLSFDANSNPMFYRFGELGSTITSFGRVPTAPTSRKPTWDPTNMLLRVLSIEETPVPILLTDMYVRIRGQ